MNLFVFLLIATLICITSAISGFLAVKKEEKYKNGFGRKLNLSLFVIALLFCTAFLVYGGVSLFYEFKSNYATYSSIWEALFLVNVQISYILAINFEKVLLVYFSLIYFIFHKRTKERTIFSSITGGWVILNSLLMGIYFLNRTFSFMVVIVIMRFLEIYTLLPIMIFQTVQNFVAVFRKPKAESDENDLQLQAKPKLKGVFASVLLAFFCFVFAMIVFVINAAVLIPTPSLSRVQSFALDDETPEIIVLVKEKRLSLHHSEYVFYIYRKDGLFAKEIIADIELELYPKDFEVVWEEDEAKVRFIGKNKAYQPVLLGEYTVTLN
jgi:hypothetical protein